VQNDEGFAVEMQQEEPGEYERRKGLHAGVWKDNIW
jgi:hypothetical protein